MVVVGVGLGAVGSVVWEECASIEGEMVESVHREEGWSVHREGGAAIPLTPPPRWSDATTGQTEREREEEGLVLT